MCRQSKFARVAASLMKCKSLQNSARQQNTLGCQRGMPFFPSENQNLSRRWKYILQRGSKAAQHPICRQKVLPEKISIQILLLFKLVQASKVDKMNDG
jgi:hypothetical protein